MFHHARLFVNRHLYGTEHGLPVSKLEDQQTDLGQNGVCMQTTRTARIIDGELFLLVTYRIHDSQGNSRSYIGS